jgi:hypothetical protein
VESHEGDASAIAHAVAQISAQPDEHRGQELDKACVTDQARKLSAQALLNIVRVVRLEIAIMRLMKMDQNGHDFAHTQTSFSLPLHFTYRN